MEKVAQRKGQRTWFEKANNAKPVEIVAAEIIRYAIGAFISHDAAHLGSDLSGGGLGSIDNK